MTRHSARPPTLARVAHSHTHSHSSGPAPLSPLAAKIVVGLLAAIGLATVIGAVLLWPHGKAVDIPLPFQNAHGGAVSTEAGHVVSTGMNNCGSPSVGAVLTSAPATAAPGAGASARPRPPGPVS